MAMFNDNSESAIKNLATLMSMYPDDPVEMTDEELAARDAAALKILNEMQETCAAATSYQQRLQEKETARQKIIMQQKVQEQKKMVERSKNPHPLWSKKWWRWDQYGDDSHMDCKTCGERVNFASWAHCSDRCLIDDVGYEAYQDAMRVSGGMKLLRYRPGWKSEFEKVDV